MGARHKLNTVVIWTCLIVSALVGLACESWGVFWGVLVVTIGGCFAAGDIRTRPAARPSRAATASRVRRHQGRDRRR